MSAALRSDRRTQGQWHRRGWQTIFTSASAVHNSLSPFVLHSRCPASGRTTCSHPTHAKAS